MNKNVFSLERDLILGTVYISPEGATVYNSFEKGGIGLLEEKDCKIIDSYENVDMVLAGDFNSRTGELDDFIINDSPDFIPELSENPNKLLSILRYAYFKWKSIWRQKWRYQYYHMCGKRRSQCCRLYFSKY